MISAQLPKPPPEAEALAAYIRAMKGDVTAMTDLATAYYFGTMGLTENYRAAFEWYQPAVAAGDPKAMCLLASLYKGGYPFPPQDFAMARRLYEISADQGYIPSQLGLADFCYRGVAGPIDLAKARQLFRLAAQGGNTGGMRRLAYLLDKGLGGLPDYKGAAYWYLRAAKSDPDEARYLLSKWTERWSIETRMAIQIALRDEHYYTGAIDGFFGESSHAAIRECLGPIKPPDNTHILEALQRMARQRNQKLT